MDLNAGRIITGEKTIEEVGEEAFELLIRVLSGEIDEERGAGLFRLDGHFLSRSGHLTIGAVDTALRPEREGGWAIAGIGLEDEEDKKKTSE